MYFTRCRKIYLIGADNKTQKMKEKNEDNDTNNNITNNNEETAIRKMRLIFANLTYKY